MSSVSISITTLIGILSTIFIFWGVIIALCGVVIAWQQLVKMNNQAKADFTYRIYVDLLKWLNDHRDFKKWQCYPNKRPLSSDFEEWDVEDYLGYYEAIWSLEKKGLIDKDIIYDVLSDYLISIYEANDFELKKKIDETREKDGKDFWEGVEKLYKEMKEYESKKGIVKRIHSHKSQI